MLFWSPECVEKKNKQSLPLSAESLNCCTIIGKLIQMNMHIIPVVGRKTESKVVMNIPSAVKLSGCVCLH